MNLNLNFSKMRKVNKDFAVTEDGIVIFDAEIQTWNRVALAMVHAFATSDYDAAFNNYFKQQQEESERLASKFAKDFK